jgi:TolB-like protein/DNA-binding winged helix-turn-helix (wHTH) protein
VSLDFRVGPFTVRPNMNTISQNGTSVRLEPKVMGVLVYLASQPGEAISKDSIIKAVWHGTFVSDDALARSISELRRAFQDDARAPRFIETIPKRGYRLIAPVEPVDALTASAPVALSNPELVPKPALWMKVGVSVIGMILSLGTLVLLNAGGLRDRILKRKPGAIRSLAVLPLQSLSDDPKQEFLAEGVTDALITDLAQTTGVRVVSRTTMLRYGHPEKPLSQIARQLDVDGIVEGTVQTSGNRVRITAQLIYGPSDQHLWAKSFEGDAKDGLELQRAVCGEIAREIAAKLRPAAEGSRQNSLSVNPRAVEAYAEARSHMDRATKFTFDRGKAAQRQELQGAFSALDKAIEWDSSYRPAYLAYFEALDNADFPRPYEYLPKARAGLLKALALGDEDMEAHLAMAKMLVRYEYDWAGAEKEYKRAIEVNPSSGYAHFAYSEYLANVGRAAEAAELLSMAQSLSPAHDYFNDHFAVLQRADLSLERQRQALEQTQANNPFVLMIMAKNYGIAARFRDSVEMWERCLTLYGRPDFADILRKAEAEGGPRFALEQWMRALEKDPAAHEDLPVGMAAFTYSSLGNKDRAFAWLDKAVQQRDWCIPFLRRDNVWNPIRSDPRFTNLLRRVGLPS